MRTNNIHICKTSLHTQSKRVQGELVEIGNESFYKICHYDRMPPFFMNIVSDSDLWMFISSNGALTAGRRDPDNALFPYYTDDRIHDSHDITGSKSILLVNRDDSVFLWEPFSARYENLYHTQRNIYKNIIGNRLIFEEINFDLNLSFLYSWANCDRFGFVKKSWVVNNDASAVTINLIDGIQNILPAGVNRKFQLEYSTLVDGYKKSEFHAETGLALYTLSSAPTDKAEPSESLITNTVWSEGHNNVSILLSAKQLDAFRNGLPITQETDIKATRGAYFLQTEFSLPAGQKKAWYIVADLNKDHSKVAALSQFLLSTSNLSDIIEEEVSKGTENLSRMIAQADGFQLGEDKPTIFRHCSNTLFNILRGGIFDNGYLINKSDFQRFLRTADQQIAEKYTAFLEKLPEKLGINELLSRLDQPGPNFEKLCHEYLPLTFSRRHGDPSRPWNHFSIIVKDEQGNKKLNYQGNWRDIFQNWEALAYSFPEFIESMITKFVNASTPDGYNPYRVTRDGFEWEELNPEDEWSYIGYWNDHQIIYLLKLLELSANMHPGKLQAWLGKEIFCYANVPYRIKSYQEILQDPHNTIDFDYDLNEEIQRRVQQMGTNGKFVFDKSGKLYFVNLAEKILLPLLIKLSNFIPEAGIWMNTQRPEWNDANNALVGFGASMVTLYYIRRYISFCMELFSSLEQTEIHISEEVSALFYEIRECLKNNEFMLSGSVSDQHRKRITDQLGQAGSAHRLKIYAEGFSGNRHALSIAQLHQFLELGLRYVDHSIKANKRNDDLYHSYNLIKITDRNGISIRRMHEMLEGQVAVLSSGYLTPEDAVILLNSLRKSALYREDQDSYVLYPVRELPRFMEKNCIPAKLLAQSRLLNQMLEQNDKRIVSRDVHGHVHFNSRFRNSRILQEALRAYKYIEPEQYQHEEQVVLDIYESIFDHQSFTGRSGTFYKYEGLGCIYWHMVSKLLLAVQESFYRAIEAGATTSVLEKLKSNYYEIRKGIGVHKNPALYGAFPTDPYSHTPQHSGAQQPGMTGQVKEDYISRFGELGVRIRNGKIIFNTALLDKEELLKKSQVFEYYDVTGTPKSMMVNHGMLAFTLCQVPVIYIPGDESKVIVTRQDGSEVQIPGFELNDSCSKSIFRRENHINNIRVIFAERDNR